MQPLAADQLERICSSMRPLGRVETSYFHDHLQDIAGAFIRQREQPTPSKSDARYQLKQIAHQARGLETDDADIVAARSRLRSLINDLSDLAHNQLWRGLDLHPGYDKRGFIEFLHDPKVDWKIVGEAAETGLRNLPNGDYSDATASLAVEKLIILYELVTGRKATFSTVPIGPLGSNGRHREVGNSRCFHFVAAFFREADADVTPLWLTGNVRTFLRARRKLGAKQLKRGIDLLNGDTLSQV